jgi:hypothetical protein
MNIIWQNDNDACVTRRIRLGTPGLRAGLILLLGCCFLQGHASAGATNPNDARTGPGYLKVFSSTQESQWGEGSYYYLHSGYRIFDANGRAVKWVENHSDSADETPQKVELAPGAYTIWALSDQAGYMKLPVVIKAARTTAVQLETKGELSEESIDSNVALKKPMKNFFSTME